VDNNSYNIKDKAQEIVNILKDNNINLENIDYQELERLLKESCRVNK
jgi:hypothetical protein